MKKTYLMIVMTGVVCSFLAGFQNNLTAFDILEKIDKNMVFKTAYSEVKMIITIRNRVINKTMYSYSEGNEKSFVEFLSPARDKGTKLLKIDDVIKIYYPSAERIMRLSGHMLRQSMMGSDFSYEDMTERSKKLREEYTGKVKEDEIFMDKKCHVLILTSKKDKETYFTRKIWVDKERFIGLKEELYAKSGKLLKVLTVDKIQTYKNRNYPTEIVMRDMLRDNSSTKMIVTKIDFDIPIPDGTFSERNLQKR